jgi:hypothetical protein
VYVEAAQALARRVVLEGGRSDAERAVWGFRSCLARPPSPEELDSLLELHRRALERYRGDRGGAISMATDPLGPLEKDPRLARTEAADLAAWTVAANVLLNLDEFLARR